MWLFNKVNRLLRLIQRGWQPSSAKYLTRQQRVKPIVKIGNSVGNDWDRYRKTIIDEFLQHPMDFLRQPYISRTIHPNQQKIAEAYLDELSQVEFVSKTILPRLHDLPIGNPYLCERFPLVSPMTVQHAYYLFLINQHLGFFLPNSELNHILELGGGYGNFCRIVCNLGYSGRYIITDLLEMHSIQRHYLSFALPEHIKNQTLEFRSLEDPNILPRSEEGTSLFMATFSLSEMPLEKRLEIEPSYKYFNYIFIAFNKSFDAVDNQEYFESLRNRIKKDFMIKIIQDKYRSAWFLFGIRQDV